MGSSDNMIIWWYMVKCSVPQSLVETQELFEKKESSYPQSMSRLYSKILLQKTLSVSAIDISIAIWPYNLLDDITQVDTISIGYQVGHIKKQQLFFVCLFLCFLVLQYGRSQFSVQRWNPCLLQQKRRILTDSCQGSSSINFIELLGLESYTQMRNMLPPKSQEFHQTSCLVWLSGGARCNNLTFTLEEIPWHAIYHWILRSFTEVEGP